MNDNARFAVSTFGRGRLLEIEQNPKVDYLEAGETGPFVVLLHSSVSGARQWRRLMEDLKARYRVRAINLIGHGQTPSWPDIRPQLLDDQARLVEFVLPDSPEDVFLVGHSFGGSVAMKAAALLANRVTKLVLLEPNPFYLLEQAGRDEAFAEAMEMRNCVKKYGALGEWETAAERFANYWAGVGAWHHMSLERRAAFMEGLKPNYFEWDAVLSETTSAEQWSALLPPATLLTYDPDTMLPIRKIAAILRKACPHWCVHEVPGTGHMAPLTHPHIINPNVMSFLDK